MRVKGKLDDKVTRGRVDLRKETLEILGGIFYSKGCKKLLKILWGSGGPVYTLHQGRIRITKRV